ncbi:MAG: orotate phosphoribosyltransferase [Candidatus Diapherotrites archaeon]
MNAENVAEILLEIKAVTLNPSKPYRYASGILSPIYTDNRLLMGYPEHRKKIIGAMAELMEKRKIKCNVIAGTATAGIPHAAWLADKTGKPMVYVRSEEKQHGKQNKIEGLVQKGWKAVVVEDLISTGGSSVETVRGLREAGIKTEDIVAIFTYNMKAATDKFLAEKISLFALTDFATLINVAAKKKYITEQEKETALEWNKDPKGWGKEMGFE